MILVEIEFSRIQTFLFASPRLRAMLGANSLLAKTVRVNLTELAHACGAQPDPAIHLPSGVPDDPLHTALGKGGKTLLMDDPAQLYKATGVLIRDGGHFRASFAAREQAEAFAAEALKMLTAELPGLRCECKIDNNPFIVSAQTVLPYAHPGWQVCQVMGDRPATKEILRDEKRIWISEEEDQQEKQGAAFRNDPVDIIAILEASRTIPVAGKPFESLDKVARHGYLALIHADGNSIGSRFKKWAEADKGSKEDKNKLKREAHAEHFFHSMRVAVRCALCEALKTVFGEEAEPHYQLLMLGGDDLLLVCSAEHAFPFITAYAQALEEYPLCDGEKLSIGAGIFIAKDSFPFYRMHKAAEELAGSAKRLYRANPDLGSVVDWCISTNSWVDEDPMAERQQLYAQSAIVGSARPYSVLNPIESIPSLQSLRDMAGKIQSSDKQNKQDKQIARSQLRAFQEVLRSNDPAQAELAWLETPRAMFQALKDSGMNDWFLAEDKGQGQGRKLSIMGDLIDLIEISHLGTTRQ